MRSPNNFKERPISPLLIVFCLTWLLVIGMTLPVAAQDRENREDTFVYDASAEDDGGYSDGAYGRIQFAENGLELQRAVLADDKGAGGEAGVNTPIYPGDSLSTGYDQRTEVELGDGSLIRIDRKTELTFLSMPSPYAEIRDNTILQLSRGSIRILTLSDFDDDGEEFRIDTPTASIYVLDTGDLRIEVDANGVTHVTSRRGVAELVGTDGSVVVRAGTQSTVRQASRPTRPEPFNTFVSDSFDRWVDERDDFYRARERYAGNGNNEAYDSLPDEVRPYYRELSSQGSWRYTADYGYVWSPNDVPAGWRPYRDGRWDYGPRGYFWVSYDPWGWAPYRYGRWNWISGYGWSWSPGRVFGGAWVAWSWGSVHVGWSALNYWNQPCYAGPLYYGYYDPYAWTFVNYSHLHHHYPYRYAVGVHSIRDELRGSAVVTRPPRIAPSRLASSESARRTARLRGMEDRSNRIDPVIRNRPPRESVRDTERISRGRIASEKGRDRRPPVTDTTSQGRSVRPRTLTTPGGRRTTARPSVADDSRMRTIYDRMNRPRTTRDRSTTTRERPEASSSRTDRGRTSTRPSTRAPSRRDERSSPSRATPSRPRSVRPTTPRRQTTTAPRPSTPTRPRGTSSSGRSSSSRSKPKSSSSGRSSSSRSKPKSSGSGRSSSSRSKPKSSGRRR